MKRQLLRQIKQIQHCEDAAFSSSLPFSSKYLIAPALSALARMHEFRTNLKEFAYRQGIFHEGSLSVPVISISNLTEASGKTPFCMYLARHYWQNHSMPSLILQLGGGTVDETVMIRNAFVDTPITVTNSSNTSEVRDILRENPNLKLIILDDGSTLGGQHLPVSRDLSIVTLNGLNPFGTGHLKPRGTLRERVRPALRRADSVVLHHVDITTQDRIDNVMKKLAPDVPKHALRIKTQMTPTNLRSVVPGARSLDMSATLQLGDLMGERFPLSRLSGAAVVCLTGVGIPSTVGSHLYSLGALYVEGVDNYEDHHEFSLDEVEAAVQRVRELAADPKYSHAAIIMSEKDFARQSEFFATVFAQYTNEVCEGGKWGAYVLESELTMVEHDQRFSTQGAMLGAMLRLAIDNCRRRTYTS